MFQERKNSNRQIAKNAAALYFRMIVSMLVGLYTSRIILNQLGVEDYGIYNVVGGFVSLFSLISDSIQGSISRFLTFELGRGDIINLRKVFASSILVLIGLSIIILFLTETFGLWYLYNKMVIPLERIDAAFWCFQLSIITFVINLINSPYTSAIIAHERMDIYAYLTILGVIFKLFICFAIIKSPIDKLIFYAILLCLYSIINQIIYVIFCKHKFPECKFKYIIDKSLLKNMFNFAGWNFIGSSAVILRTQGANLFINAFGGPVANAANGIANNICNIVSTFVTNFTMAFNPQITKRYAAKEYESLMNLLIYGSKYSYFLMFILTLPVFLNAEYIFKIWLGIVPEYTVIFTRWTLLFLLLESISRPMITAKIANGNIRNYQIVVGSILLLMLPISYLGLKLGFEVTFVAFANVLTALIAIFARIYMLRGDFPCWSSKVFFNKVILNICLVSIIASVLPAITYIILPKGFINFTVTTLISIISSCITIFYIGCTKFERSLIVDKIKEIYYKKTKKDKESI